MNRQVWSYQEVHQPHPGMPMAYSAGDAASRIAVALCTVERLMRSMDRFHRHVGLDGGAGPASAMRPERDIQAVAVG